MSRKVREDVFLGKLAAKLCADEGEFWAVFCQSFDGGNFLENDGANI